jgi:hypothetical protein
MSEIKFPSMVVILTSLSTSFTLSSGFDKDGVVFNIAGIPYCPPRTPTDIRFLRYMKTFCYKRLHEAVIKKYRLIMLNNTPLTLEVLQELHDRPKKPNASDWQIVSFFHDIPTLKDCKIPLTDFEYVNPKTLIGVRDKDMDSLYDYPFIKKIFIPYDFKVSPAYIKSLFST